tara:strand:+ start:14714 stop:14980 length:267 start_codon:yes stop_codon:yes gene_type:complete
MGIELRPYQQDIITRGVTVLQNHKFIYLAMEVRTGKTITSLKMLTYLWAKLVNSDEKKVLFITKKKAISSIERDYDLSHSNFDIKIRS